MFARRTSAAQVRVLFAQHIIEFYYLNKRERELERQARGERSEGPAARMRMNARMNTTPVKARVAPERQGISKTLRPGGTAGTDTAEHTRTMFYFKLLCAQTR